MTKRITREQERQAALDVAQIRMALLSEAELLAETYDPRLIAYVALTTSMRMAAKADLSPVAFAKLVGETLSLHSQPEGITVRFVGLSDLTEQ